MLVVVPVLVSLAAQLPLWPPATRLSVMSAPDPEVFQPVRSVSKPGLPTRLGLTTTCDVFCDAWPAVSVTVTVTV